MFRKKTEEYQQELNQRQQHIRHRRVSQKCYSMDSFINFFVVAICCFWGFTITKIESRTLSKMTTTRTTAFQSPLDAPFGRKSCRSITTSFLTTSSRHGREYQSRQQPLYNSPRPLLKMSIINDQSTNVHVNNNSNNTNNNNSEKDDFTTSFLPDRRSVLVRASSSSLVAALLGLGTGTTMTNNENGGGLVANALDSDETKRINIFEKISPSVVFIDTFVERRDALSTNVMEVPLGSGSGFVWDKAGHIVTNYHVVRNSRFAQVTILLSGEIASRVGVTNNVSNNNSDNNNNNPTSVSTTSTIPSSDATAAMSTTTTTTPTKNTNSFTSMRPITGADSQTMVRKVFTAKIVGVDPGKDIAVLKIDADTNVLFPIAVGTSTGLRVGQTSLAIGNPFGLDHTLTVGVISGTGREVKSPIGRPISDVIQTDAAINPGNSGGPLLDSSGKLIGMNTAIYSPSGGSAGIGFAIPVDTVRIIVDTLIKDGLIVRPVLGITYLGSKQARTLGITSGVLVLDVPTGTPPARAGLKGTKRTDTGLIELGDIIRNVNGRTINTEGDLFQALEKCKPGDVVAVTVQRIMAVNDELVVRDITLQIPLSESTKFEKIILQEQFQQQQPSPHSMPFPQE